jgi:hypothetical protein
MSVGRMYMVDGDIGEGPMQSEVSSVLVLMEPQQK